MSTTDNLSMCTLTFLGQSLMPWNICEFCFVDSVLICADLGMNNPLALSVWFCIIFWGRGSKKRISKTETKTFNFVLRYADVGPSINCPKVHLLRFLIFITHLTPMVIFLPDPVIAEMTSIFDIIGIHLFIVKYQPPVRMNLVFHTLRSRLQFVLRLLQCKRWVLN
jgi:hypothetical protein